MRRLAPILPLLLLAACAPAAERQADICAIQALPARPGVDRFGVSPGVEHAAQTKGDVYGPGVMPGAAIAWWGHCPRRDKTTDMLLIGPGPWALTKGGPRAHGRQLTYGTCYYRKTRDGWTTVACRINP